MASVLESFSEGFRLTSAHYRLFFVPTIAVLLIQGAGFLITESPYIGLGALLLLAPIIGFLGAASQVWLYARALGVVTGKDHPFRWSAALALWGYLIIISLITQLLGFIMGLSLIMSFGLLPITVLLVLFWPALIVFVLIRFTWFVPEIASDDREEGAFSRTYELTTDHFWQITLFMLLSILLVITGLIALGVGIVFALPLTVVASVHYYERLRKEQRLSSKRSNRDS
jgi:hypothetical protein